MTDTPHQYAPRSTDPAVVMLEVVLGEIRHVRNDMVTRAEHLEAQNGHHREHRAIRGEIAAVAADYAEMKAARQRVPRWLRITGTVFAIVGVICSATLGAFAVLAA